MPQPSFRATEQQRKLIKSVSAMALRQDQMCKLVGLRSPKTLRKHFPDELVLGPIEAQHNVRRTLFKLATSGRNPGDDVLAEEVGRLERKGQATGTGRL